MKRKAKSDKKNKTSGLTRISLKGYKSIAKKCSIEIRPITILSGANSSGKSSIMQPLLLMKQTLDSFSEPGVLKINGPHVYFTKMNQIFSRNQGSKTAGNSFEIEMEEGDVSIKNVFSLDAKGHMKLKAMNYRNSKHSYKLTASTKEEDLLKILPELFFYFVKESNWNSSVGVVRRRCFYDIEVLSSDGSASRPSSIPLGDYKSFADSVSEMIHLPALRGNPERSYSAVPVSRQGSPGVFNDYIAGTIKDWQDNDRKKIKLLINNLREIGMADRIVVEAINDTEVSLKVGRYLSSKKKDDLVDIADVGFGISQILPILVALITAKPGQLVYIEQPEIHLHPKAQNELVQQFIEAANRGVRMVIETHSDILISALQDMIKQEKLNPGDVSLNWFQIDKDGSTAVKEARLDQKGDYKGWPEDFCGKNG